MGDNNHLNLVMLGSDNLTSTLERQVRSVCNSDDEFLHQDEVFSLDYRCVSGDVSLPENAFRTQDFLPHGKPITNHTFRLSHLALSRLFTSRATAHMFLSEKHYMPFLFIRPTVKDWECFEFLSWIF